jgi:hypothetical protein
MSMAVSRPEETLLGASMGFSRPPAPLLDTSMTVSRPMETAIATSRASFGAPGTLDRGQPPPEGGVAEFRRMEEKVEGQAGQVAASREIEEALSGGGSTADLEARFARLEHSGGGDKPAARRSATSSPR